MNAGQNLYRETLHGERSCWGVAGHVYQPSQSDDSLSTRQKSILVTQASVPAQAAVSPLDLLEAGTATWAARASTQIHHHNVYHPAGLSYYTFMLSFNPINVSVPLSLVVMPLQHSREVARVFPVAWTPPCQVRHTSPEASNVRRLKSLNRCGWRWVSDGEGS